MVCPRRILATSWRSDAGQSSACPMKTRASRSPRSGRLTAPSHVEPRHAVRLGYGDLEAFCRVQKAS